MLRTLMALSACVAIGGCVATVATVRFPGADSNDDDVLSLAEFREFFDDTDAYERYDDDDDGSLSREEYNEAVDSGYEGDAYFTGLDTDRSGNLSRAEFIDGWFGMFDGGDDTMTRGEFENAVGSLELEL